MQNFSDFKSFSAIFPWSPCLKSMVRMAPPNPMMMPRPQVVPAGGPAVQRPTVPIPAAGPITTQAPVQAPLAAPVAQPVVQQPKPEIKEESKSSDPPKFVFKPKNEPVASQPTQPTGSFFSSTPARHNTKQFVFKSRVLTLPKAHKIKFITLKPIETKYSGA